MIIYPAIDLKGGRCVRLYQGDMTRETVYNDDPAAQAREWARAGFFWLHVVDLDGALHGAPENQHAVRDILKAVDIPVQLGGGIRSHAHIEHWLAAGISRVILGTAAVRDPDMVRAACRDYPGQVALGIDARAGRVSVEGWMNDAEIGAAALARHFEDAGAAAIIYTDIDRDGTGKGINIEATIALARTTAIPVIASGGAGSMADLEAVRDAAVHGVSGVILGKALYDGRLAPEKVLALSSVK